MKDIDIYFSTDKEGRKAYYEYKKKFDIVFEKKYKELWWNPEDPTYSKYPKEMIECHNDEVRRILEDQLWGSDLDEFTKV